MIDTKHIQPVNDGIDHINVYSKAHTELGKLLSNFAHSPFEHPKYGHFESVEGFWYYRGMVGKLPEETLKSLRYKHGFKAKELGKELRKTLPAGSDEDDSDFPEDVMEAIRCKLRQNRRILNLLVETKLPFVHYYYYGKVDNAKLIFSPKYDWMIDEISRIRDVTQEFLKTKKNNSTGVKLR